MVKTYQKAAALLLVLALIFAFPVTASAAETTEARVPVTLTVVNMARGNSILHRSIGVKITAGIAEQRTTTTLRTA